MNHLLSLNTAADRASITQTNFERLDAGRPFALNPTKVDGVATTIVGPPDSGEHYVGELWTDALCAEWRCTVAGTPGTWVQISPAFVDAGTLPGGAPDGYWVRRTDEHFKEYYYDAGTPSWEAVNP